MFLAESVVLGWVSMWIAFFWGLFIIKYWRLGIGMWRPSDLCDISLFSALSTTQAVIIWFLRDCRLNDNLSSLARKASQELRSLSRHVESALRPKAPRA